MTLAPLALAAGLAAAQAMPSLGQKPYGVLLLGQGGGDEWGQTVEAARKALGKGVPLEFAPGLADDRAMQKAIDALEGQKVLRVVVVPLFESSYDAALDQSRFLLGLRNKPSPELMNAAHSHAGAGPRRLDVKVPVAMSQALDDHPLLAQILAERARKSVWRSDRETLVLAGLTPLGKDNLQGWTAMMTSLAEKTRQAAGMKSAALVSLSEDAGQDARDKSEEQARRAIRQAGRQGRAVVVADELSPGALGARLPKVLEGVFAGYDARAILPDPRIARWIKESAAAAAKLSDMRAFKGDGARRGLPAMPPLRAPGDKK